MYSVSDDYLTKIVDTSREVSWYGTITLSSGTTLSFDTSTIASGGLSYEMTLSSEETPGIGNTCAGELRLNLYTDVDRYLLYGAEVVPYFRLYLTDSTYEDVPLGVFYVEEANRTSSMVSLVCYDAMTTMDDTKVVTDIGEATPYTWINTVVTKAGLTLGTTQAEIEALPNGTETIQFTLCTESITEMTCRDALGYLCSVVCANAYIGRDGLVYIVPYSMTAIEDIDESGRFSSSFSDYTVTYTAVSLTVYATGTTEYYAEDTDDGLTLELGTNPWMQSGTATGRETVCTAVLDEIATLAYTPFSVSMPVRPEFDIVDVLTFSGNQASSDKGAITSISYSSSGSMTIECTGANPRMLGAKTKTEKALAALTSTVAKEINQMSVVQNSSAITVAENTETSLLAYNFEVTAEENTTMIDVSVALTAEAVESETDDVYTLSDIVAALTFYVDDSQVTVYDPEFIIDEGKDTMTFNYSLSGLSVGAHEFDVRLTMAGGTGSIAAGDVHEMLWGYGITFEVYVKSIEITSYPTQRVFLTGSDLDYTGLEITANYNNGVTEDITADCTLDPEDGTTTTQEEDITVSASYTDDEGKEFTADFDMWVVDGDFANNVLYRGIGSGRAYYKDLSSLEGYNFSTSSNSQYYQLNSSSMIKANQHDLVWEKTYYTDYLVLRNSTTTLSVPHDTSYPVACEIMDGLVYLDESSDGCTYTFHHVSGDATKGVISDTEDCSVTLGSSNSITLWGTNRSMYAIATVRDFTNSNYYFGLYDAYNRSFTEVLNVGSDEFSNSGNYVSYAISETGDVYFLFVYGYNNATSVYLYSIISGVKTLTNITSVLSWYRNNTAQVPYNAIYYDETNACLVVYLNDPYRTPSTENWSFLTRGWKLNTDGSLIEELTLPDDVYIDGAESHLYLNGTDMVGWNGYTAHNIKDSNDLPVSNNPITSVSLGFFDDNGMAYNHQGMLVKSGEYNTWGSTGDYTHYYYYYYFDNLYFEESDGNIAFKGVCNN